MSIIDTIKEKLVDASPTILVKKEALKESINSLWEKYDEDHNKTLDRGEFKNLLRGCAKNLVFRLAAEAVSNQVYDNLKQNSKNKKTALSQEDVFSYARKNKIKIGKNDSLNTIIETNIDAIKLEMGVKKA